MSELLPVLHRRAEKMAVINDIAIIACVASFVMCMVHVYALANDKVLFKSAAYSETVEKEKRAYDHFFQMGPMFFYFILTLLNLPLVLHLSVRGDYKRAKSDMWILRKRHKDRETTHLLIPNFQVSLTVVALVAQLDRSSAF